MTNRSPMSPTTRAFRKGRWSIRALRPCGRSATDVCDDFRSVGGAGYALSSRPLVRECLYGTKGIEVWAHPAVARRIVDSYTPLQGADPAAALGPFEKRMKDAKSELERAHAQSDLNAFAMVFQLANASVLAVPNRPIDPDGRFTG